MKIITGLLLALSALSAFAETQPAPTSSQNTAPTSSQNTTPTTPKESATSIIDFCRTHTC